MMNFNFYWGDGRQGGLDGVVESRLTLMGDMRCTLSLMGALLHDGQVAQGRTPLILRDGMSSGHHEDNRWARWEHSTIDTVTVTLVRVTLVRVTLYTVTATFYVYVLPGVFKKLLAWDRRKIFIQLDIRWFKKYIFVKLLEDYLQFFCWQFCSTFTGNCIVFRQ